jgi:ADYC domain
VIGADIVNMTLVVELNDENNDVKQYTLMFDSYNPTPPVRLVNVQWKVTGTPNAPTQYCFRGPPGPPKPEWSPNLTSPPPGADPDVVAFQQDIAVNAINANILDRDMSYVTMSCSYGAMATVRAWGYTYKNGSNTQDFFDAALHMKRASYCGDDAYYTYNGTEIFIGDNASPNPVNSDSGWSMSTIEALWGPKGAVCVNENHRRHYAAVYPGFGPFTNTCGLHNCTWYCNQTPQPSFCNVDFLSSRPVIDPNP